jgi:hypothetical protein
MTKIRILTLAIVIFLTACTSMDTVMASWTGNTIDDLTASWGAPSSRIERQDGGATYTWSTLSSNQYGVHECRKTFVANSAGTITTWSYTGCKKHFLK